MLQVTSNRHYQAWALTPYSSLSTREISIAPIHVLDPTNELGLSPNLYSIVCISLSVNGGDLLPVGRDRLFGVVLELEPGCYGLKGPVGATPPVVVKVVLRGHPDEHRNYLHVVEIQVGPVDQALLSPGDWAVRCWETQMYSGMAASASSARPRSCLEL